MSALLNHIVGLALGRKDESAARLVLPPRFAESGIHAVPETVNAPQPPVSPSFETTAPLETRPDVVAEIPQLQTPQRTRRPIAPEAPEQSAITPTKHPRKNEIPVPQYNSTASLALPPRSAQTAPFLQQVPKIAVVNHPSPVPVPFVQSAARPNTPPVTPRLQPLSQATVASIRQASNSPPPVIEVVIDRIDIRAPAAERPAPQAKRRPREPSVALGDFLRGQGQLP
jgi:hypothetical protein